MEKKLSGAASWAITGARWANRSQRATLYRAREPQSHLGTSGPSKAQIQRSFTSTSPSTLHNSAALLAGGYNNELRRQKKYQRQAFREEISQKRREKDKYAPIHYPPRDDRPADAERAELEEQIQAYMASTGPKGERLNMQQKMKLLRQELGGLATQLDMVEKKASSDEETAHLPELDDQVLGEIYQALMLPPPPSAEETRLARIAIGRKEQALIESARGRRQLTALPVSSLPPSIAEERRTKLSRTLQQKLIDATERGRTLLPPTPKPKSTSLPQSLECTPGDALRTNNEDQRNSFPDMDDISNIYRLPREDRREIRLQQLIARLAIVRADAQSSETIEDLRAGLAARIAEILRKHDYILPSQSSEASGTSSAVSSDSTDTVKLSEFPSLRLDALITPSHDTTERSDPTIVHKHDAQAELQQVSEALMTADTMLQNLGSPASISFMLDEIERLLPSDEAPATDSMPNDEITTASDTQPSSSMAVTIPLGVASTKEWTALAVAAAKADDWHSLLRTVHLMDRAGVPSPPLDLLNQVLDIYANRGDVGSCLQILSWISAHNLVADEYTYHSLTKVYLKTAQFAKAIELLNSLEAQDKPASIKTYTMVISKLIDFSGLDTTRKEQRPELQSLAWSIFYHMRFVAHAIPDAPLYALMIRACAKGIPQPQDIDDPTQVYTSLTSESTAESGSGYNAAPISEAERALDLFREMTTRYGVRPNAEVYNSLILACARRKDFYLEAFRLLREMVELENERVGLPSESSDGLLRFAPDRYTFNALLQGCAKNRDLPRARWVLAEMIRTTLPLFDDEIRAQLTRDQKIEMLSKRPNEETMCHLFHAYGSFDPPIKRQELKLQDGQDTASDKQDPSKLQEDAVTEKASSRVVTTTQTDSGDVVRAPSQDEDTTAEDAAQVFSALVPQTSADVISEARSLFARVLADQPHDGVEGSLGAVKPTIRIVNHYIAVLSAHLPDEVKGRMMASILFGDPQTNTVEKAAIALRSDSEDVPQSDRTLEESLIARMGLTPNEHTFRVILHAYSVLPAFKFAEAQQELADQVQAVWSKFNDFAYGETRPVLDLKQVKQCWTAYIHFWAKHSALKPSTVPAVVSSTLPGIDIAMDALQRFAELYPPRPSTAPRVPSLSPNTNPLYGAPLHRRASVKGDKTDRVLKKLDLSPFPLPQKSLESLRVLSKLYDNDSRDSASAALPSPEDRKTKEGGSLPTISFVDVELLHHRLLRYSRIKDLAFLTWFLRRSAAASRPRGSSS